MLNKLKDELREARETQYKDKADANARSQNEIKNLNERVAFLNLNLFKGPRIRKKLER